MTVIHRVVTHSTIQQVKQALRLVPSLVSTKGDGAVPVPMTELTFALPFAMAFCYKAGTTERTGDPHPINKLVPAFVEAALSYGLIQHLPGAFFSISLLLGARNVGIAESKTDKIKAAIRSALSCVSAYGIAQLGILLTDGLYLLDASSTRKSLQGRLKPMLTANNPGNPLMMELKPLLNELDRSSSRLLGVLRNGNKEQVRLFKQQLEQAGDRLVQRTALLSKAEWSKLGAYAKDLGKLTQEINISRFYRPLRLVNPIIGFLIGTSIVGPLLAHLVSKWLFPETVSETPDDVLEQQMDSLWMNQILGSGYGYDAHSPFISANGPAMARQLMH